MVPPHQQYDAQAAEQRWYAYWLSQHFFSSSPDGEKVPYVVLMPPPNVTGVLHMGHVLNNTIQDVLVRRARMQGREVCWVPGLDHASIATEAKVVAMLKEKGVGKGDLSREAFLGHAWRWKEKYGGKILAQLRRFGVSCDWQRLCFTMDKGPSEGVVRAFVTLHKQGYLYRGKRMVHWDPVGGTALSDDEVIHREVQGSLYHIRYPLVGGEGHVVVATTRPETLLGDTALCVHPEDERYASLVGGGVMLPLMGRTIPVIADEYVDRTFGTGCLKVTPAHDANDYGLAVKHGLPMMEVIAEDGTMGGGGGSLSGDDAGGGAPAGGTGS